MNIKAKTASIYIPNYEKIKNMFQLLTSFLFSTYEILLQEFPEQKAKDLLITISSYTGNKAAFMLKKELNMKNNYENAILAWKIGCKLLNFSIHTQKNKNGIYFYHDKDPLWEEFRKKDINLCHYICLPMVSTIAKNIYPECEIELFRQPDLQSPCIKLLKIKK